MANKRIVIGLVLAGAAIAAHGAVVFRSKEPTWHGRTLRAWLNEIDWGNAEKRAQAADAVSHIGSNAVPFLIPRLALPEYGPVSQWSGLRTRILFLLTKQNLIKFPRPQPTKPRHQALAAIDALGPAAEGALPALEKLLHDTPPAPDAPYIIARIGPAGVPLLNQALTNDERAVRMGARLCLDALKSTSDQLIPAGPSRVSYDERICLYHARMLQAAFWEYRRQHPKTDLPPNITDPPPP